ncbi:MAG: hypothetical protein Q7O12_10945 [Deltaproteobacteria bacterium]|nr:hypothetical protein [Deltaproteobacteria bacterium]
MERKKFHFALREKAHQEIKRLATRHNCRPGNIIEALAVLVRDGKITDENLTDAIKKTRSGGWVLNEVDELIQKFENLRDLATQDGDTATANHATARIEHIKREQGKNLVLQYQELAKLAIEAGDTAGAQTAEARVTAIKKDFGLTDEDFTFTMDSEKD